MTLTLRRELEANSDFIILRFQKCIRNCSQDLDIRTWFNLDMLAQAFDPLHRFDIH